MTPEFVRSKLVDALELDLVGPSEGLGALEEVLPQAPSRWYLTGFLAPLESDDKQRADESAVDELDEAGDGGGVDDDAAPEPAAARQRFFPSSMGLSVLIPAETKDLSVMVRWGDYERRKHSDGHGSGEEWARRQHSEPVKLEKIPAESKDRPREYTVPSSNDLFVSVSVRKVPDDARGWLPRGTRSVSIFLVNRRKPAPDEVRDEAFAFQAELTVKSDEPFVPRPNLRSIESDDSDERIADLQYRDAFEYAVGHGVATKAEHCDGHCRVVRTCWIPRAEVERIAPTEIAGVTLSMDELSRLSDGVEAKRRLGPIVGEYRRWLAAQKAAVPQTPAPRKETAEFLLTRAETAAGRIEQGISLLADEQCLEAFRIANRAMAAAARRRLAVMQGKPEESAQPAWRPFQLAFLLMNLRGIAEPTDPDREVVDLLFFPTGGGKTEAYLGLSAFTLVLRRLQNPGLASAGVSVLMRYTLRLLTLDQLGRAASLICALELERQQDVDKLGPWPFEIGLWVGMAATPNLMGKKGDGKQNTARAKTIAFKNAPRTKPSPIPLEECPWCGTKFGANSFNLSPNPDEPNDLRISCMNRDCAFSRGRPLPIVAVDEPIYRRLPCFMIATVDKFAAMPWTGEVGAFFGRVQRSDKDGFYGPCDSLRGNPLPVEQLPPPDLVIQDELHLISGPLGTIAGLYETALDELCCRKIGDRKIRPKIVASTATVRRAQGQIRALFNRRLIDVFPPPMPDRRNSFFARTHTPQESNARLYLGVAAQGRSPKVIVLRVYLALLAAAQHWYDQHDKKSGQPNPADPYMTLLGYFNSLRELGGTRRLVEDEIRNRLAGYANRRRVGEKQGPFDNRKIDYEPVELTSRISTAEVSEAKRRLALPFDGKEKGRVDVAIATNMISVGLDITRLGLMVVFNQPKTSAEYIQATSRVGRDHHRPGLVVTILNQHKPRDRSHYERFTAYHESFYRSVEATSVTPFSPRALDRGLAGALVALARQAHRPMTAPKGASEILRERSNLQFVVDALAERAFSHSDLPDEDRRAMQARVKDRANDLLDEWCKVAAEMNQTGGCLQYQTEAGGAQRLLYEFLNPDLKGLPPHHVKMKFRANRSMRDVEPNVNLWLETIDGQQIEEDEA